MEIYFCGIDEFADLAGSELLSPERRARMERYRKDEDRARCLVAGLLLRMALGPRAFTLCQNAQGKPYLPQGPCFNLSHSGEYVVLGVSEHAIGVDIERIGPFEERVARRCYTDAELAWLYAQEDAGAFYRLWTAKESIMKSTGLGFSMPPESFSVLPVEDGWHRTAAGRWFLRWYALPGHALCSACASDAAGRLRCVGRAELMA